MLIVLYNLEYHVPYFNLSRVGINIYLHPKNIVKSFLRLS